MNKVALFLSTALVLGESARDRADILWRLSKNVRVRLGLARYHPEVVHLVRTRWGPVHLRDNFGDVTNLPRVWLQNEYRLERLEGEGVILDVGANIGLFAAWAAAHNPGRAIHCFEPLAANRRMIALNCPSAVIAPGGLGRQAGTVTLRVDAHAIMASTVDTSWPTQPQAFEVVPLDEYARATGIGAVAFLKLDTEGMELEILDGARETLRRVARVAMETHGEDRHRGALQRLTAAGLTIRAEWRRGATGMVFAER